MTENNDCYSIFTINPSEMSPIKENHPSPPAASNSKHFKFKFNQPSRKESGFAKLENCYERDGGMSPILMNQSQTSLNSGFNEIKLFRSPSPTQKRKRKKMRKGSSKLLSPNKRVQQLMKQRHMEVNNTIFNTDEDFDLINSSEIEDDFWNTFFTERTEGSRMREINDQLADKSCIDHDDNVFDRRRNVALNSKFANFNTPKTKTEARTSKNITTRDTSFEHATPQYSTP